MFHREKLNYFLKKFIANWLTKHVTKKFTRIVKLLKEGARTTNKIRELDQNCWLRFALPKDIY